MRGLRLGQLASPQFPLLFIHPFALSRRRAPAFQQSKGIGSAALQALRLRRIACARHCAAVLVLLVASFPRCNSDLVLIPERGLHIETRSQVWWEDNSIDTLQTRGKWPQDTGTLVDLVEAGTMHRRDMQVASHNCTQEGACASKSIAEHTAGQLRALGGHRCVCYVRL